MKALIFNLMDVVVFPPPLEFLSDKKGMSFTEASLKIKYSQLVIKNGFEEPVGYGFICMNATIWVSLVAFSSRGIKKNTHTHIISGNLMGGRMRVKV